MNLAQFNKASRDEAIATLRPCLDVDRWVEAVVDGRPFSDIEAVLSEGRIAANPLLQAEVDEALAHHPRIGEQAAGDSAEARMSASEQASLGDSSAQLEQALEQGNRHYEAKFDRVFLIRAAGRDRAEILSELRRRMTHSEAEELETVAGQLREIALLRLENTIHS